jgi:hypothetical protein
LSLEPGSTASFVVSQRLKISCKLTLSISASVFGVFVRTLVLIWAFFVVLALVAFGHGFM